MYIELFSPNESVQKSELKIIGWSYDYPTRYNLSDAPKWVREKYPDIDFDYYKKRNWYTTKAGLAPMRLYRVVYKSYFLNFYQYKVLQYLNMAGKTKSVMGAVQPEEIKKVSLSSTEHGINLKKYNNFWWLSSYWSV